MVYGILALILGIAYGYMTPGRENKMALFKKAILFGIVIAIVLALIGYLANTSAVGFGEGLVGLIISIIVISVLFVLGAWIGDWLEERKTPKQA